MAGISAQSQIQQQLLQQQQLQQQQAEQQQAQASTQTGAANGVDDQKSKGGHHHGGHGGQSPAMQPDSVSYSGQH